MPSVGESVVCISEDRPSEQVAVKLLVLSLARHCPDLDVRLTYPPAGDGFRTWLTRFPRVDLQIEYFAGASGWNVKPHAILPLLGAGAREVWWIDSDVILTRDFRERLPGLSEDTIVATEEALYGAGGHLDGGSRARAWGFELGRILPSTLNTGVVRVTRAHVPLLERWKQLLESEEYTQAQRRPWDERPKHMLSDQDVLTALLSSNEFAAVPVIRLGRGTDIIQYFGPPGYTTRERMSNLRAGLPPFVHELGGGKPWYLGQRAGTGMRAALDRVYSELSPYRLCAEEYREEIEDELEQVNWLDRTSRSGAVLKRLGMGSIPLTGLPLALAYSLWRPFKAARDALTRRGSRGTS